MYKYVIILIVFGICDIQAKSPVYYCGNSVIVPSSTEIFIDSVECVELPCQLPLGSNIDMIVTFQVGKTTEKLRPELLTYALGVENEYPLPEPDGCNSLIDMSCPVEVGEPIRYLLQVPILETYPTVSVKFRFMMYNENDERMFCFMLDGEIVSPTVK